MTSRRSKYADRLIHVSVWAAILCMPLFFTGPERPWITGTEYLRFLLVTVSFMAVFYTNYFGLIDRFLSKHRVGSYLVWNLLLIAAAMFAVHLLFRYVLPPDTIRRPHEVQAWQHHARFLLGNTMLYLLVVGASVAIRMTEQWYRAEQARRDLEHIHMQAELQNLKSQLNPHFLFNTLNNIYSLIQIDAERAQQAVHDLSSMLRYVLYESNRPTVPLKAELDFLRDYIALMRIRLPRHVRLLVSLPDETGPTVVAPLLFISLIENAFKHGVDNDRPSFIAIDIREIEGRIVCKIKNSSFPKTASDRSGSGIGLKNLSKRLEMIYPDRHTFEYGERENTYTALLCINPQVR